MASVDISGTGGAGNFVSGNYLSAYNNQIQILTGPAFSQTQVGFGSILLSNGITISGGGLTEIVFSQSGIYNIQFSLQVTNLNVQEKEFYLWASKNSVYEPDSLGILTVWPKHGTILGHQIAAWNYFFQVNAGDNVGLWWTANSTDVKIENIPSPGAGIPSAPSVILTVTQV